MKTNSVKMEKMSFKDYFNSMSTKEKNELRDQMTPAFMAYTTFYHHLRKEDWSELELQKLEQLTNKEFARC